MGKIKFKRLHSKRLDKHPFKLTPHYIFIFHQIGLVMIDVMIPLTIVFTVNLAGILLTLAISGFLIYSSLLHFFRDYLEFLCS